jgi:glutaredoxin
MNKIEIYTNETCPYCKAIKEELTNKNIKFKNKLTSDFAEEYQEAVNLVGIPTVPIVKCNDEYLLPGRDFQNPQQLVKILETFKVSKYDDSHRILERIKTLNFHINTAFGRMDQLLRQIETKINTDEHKSTD